MLDLDQIWRAMGQPAAWVAGGWVRDRLLGRPNHDLDLVVAGDLEHAAACARGLGRLVGARPHLLGRPPRSVWRLEHPSASVEIWALGELSLADDARRRDFSCNALFWSLPDGPVIDLVGGAADLAARRLRAVSRANLADDPVRLLRAARFLAQLPSFALTPETAEWAAELAPELARAPRERVGKDLLALLRAAAPGRGLAAMVELGLLAPSAPSGRADAAWLAPRLGAADRLGRRPADDPVRSAALLALLLRAWEAPSGRALRAYAWDRALVDAAVPAAGWLERAGAGLAAPAADRRELLAALGPAAPALLALGGALAAARDEPVAPWRRLARQWRRAEGQLPPAPLLSGAEIAALTGIAPGPALGRAVAALARAQTRREVRSRAAARRWALARVTR